MIKDALFIAFKDLKYMLRARETLVWVFVMPIVFFYFIGTITGGFRSTVTRKDRVAVKADESAGFLVDQLIHRLGDRDYEVVRPDSAHHFNAYARRLTVPPAFTDSVIAGVPTSLEFANESSGMAENYHTIRMQRAVYTMLADLAVVGANEGDPTPEAFERLNAMPRALTLHVEPAGELKPTPGGFEQAIPGMLVMFTLMVMATSGAILLVIERQQGLLRRLAYTPISRLAIVLGKWGGKWFLGLVQIAFGMVVGTVLFRMNWGPDLAAVIAVMFVYGAFMAALGIILGSVARSEGQAIGIGIIAANVLAALGGCWWPIEITPAWMQKLQLFLPTGWAMDALHKLISFGAGPTSVIPHLVGMLLGSIILIAVGTRVFRFD
jgi:ABC-2 type transport system permease protein